MRRVGSCVGVDDNEKEEEEEIASEESAEEDVSWNIYSSGWSCYNSCLTLFSWNHWGPKGAIWELAPPFCVLALLSLSLGWKEKTKRCTVNRRSGHAINILATKRSHTTRTQRSRTPWEFRDEVRRETVYGVLFPCRHPFSKRTLMKQRHLVGGGVLLMPRGETKAPQIRKTSLNMILP